MALKITNKKESTREQNIHHLTWRFADLILTASDDIKNNTTSLGVYDEKYSKTIKGEDWVNVTAIFSVMEDQFRNNDLLQLLLNRLTDEELEQLAVHHSIDNLSITDEI